MDDDEINGLVARIASQNGTEIIGGVHGLAIDGDERVPRLHAGLVSTAFQHDTLHVDVLLFRNELRRKTAEQQKHDERREQVGCWTCSKHAKTFSARCAHQLVGLRFSKRSQRQGAELKQAKRPHAHAVAPGEQPVTEFVNHQRHDKCNDAPAEGNHRVDAGDSDEFAG